MLLILRSLPFFLFYFFFLKRHCFAFFSCALLVTSCCCLYHLSADDETSNVLKRSAKNVRSRFGSLLYIKFIYRFDVSPLKPGSFLRTIFGSAAFAVTKKGGESLQGLFYAAHQVNLLTWICSPHSPFSSELEEEQL